MFELHDGEPSGVTNALDKVFRKFPIPQIEPYISQQIKLKPQTQVKMIQSSRKPQPAINSDNFHFEAHTEQKSKQIRYVLTSIEFKQAESFREQYHTLASHLRSDPVHPEFTFGEIAHILGVNNGESIRRQLQKSFRSPNPERRLPLISPEARTYMGNLIFSQNQKRNPVSLYEIGETLREKFSILIPIDTLAKYLRRDKVFTTAVGVPMEQKRLNISHMELLKWYSNLNATILVIPRYFIFNMDETGLDDWVDAHDYLVAVPRQGEGQETNIPVERRCKRATLTACIAADGSALKPLVILSAASIIEEILESGYTEDKVIFIYQNHGFMTKRLFKYWAQNIFFPYVKHKRLEFEYDGISILLMDQFSGHEYDEFNADCKAHGVITRPLVPHTSHLAQPLDQIIFSVFKQRFSSTRFSKFASASSNRIIRILRAWFQTISADLITSTFSGAGIVPDKILYGTVMSCKVDLARSIHLKHFLPDENPEDVTEETGAAQQDIEDQITEQTLEKRPLKRYKILKLDQKETPKKSKKPTSKVEGGKEEFEKAIGREPSTKQLTLYQSFSLKQVEHPGPPEKPVLSLE
jgi:hypothetical protein